MRRDNGVLKLFGQGVAILPAALALLLIRLLKPIVLIRLCYLKSAGMGHLGLEIELMLTEQDAKVGSFCARRHIDIYYLAELPVCNLYLAEMWSRQIRIWPRKLIAPIYYLNQKIPGGERHILSSSDADRDSMNLLDDSESHLRFTDDELRRGREALNQMGIGEGDKFVCLNVRDSAYERQFQPDKDNSRMNHRNASIVNYVKMAHRLHLKGIKVVRMGAVVESPIHSPWIIDYASNGSRTEFLDIYLAAFCFFCISTQSGFDALPNSFRKPILYTNSQKTGTIRGCVFQRNAMFIFKRHVDSAGRTMTQSEIWNQNVYQMRDPELIAAGIRLEENTPEEISDAAQEMLARVSGNISDSTDESEDRQRRFWEVFSKAMPKFMTQHGGELRARVGSKFLEEHPEWLS